MTEAAVVAALAKPQNPKLLTRDFELETFRFNRWSITLPDDCTLDDVQRPEFLGNIANKIMGHDTANPRGILDILVVRQRSTGLYAELLITEIGKGFVRSKLVREVKPEDTEPADSLPFTTRWNLGKRCHEVLRKADKAVMAGSFQTKERALAWIDDHMKAIAA